MKMMTDISSLKIYLHDREIGTIVYIGGERTIFSFNDDYIKDQNRPTLGLHFKDQFGELLIDFRPYKIKLMPFFSNLLPEGYLRKYLATRANIHTEREFFLLWSLGQDLPGAVSARSVSAEALPQYVRNGLDDSMIQAVEEDMLRFSLAGAQLKFSAVNDTEAGLAIPASGMGGNWIIKLPSREFANVPENEFSMMTLARMIGINVPAIDLVDIKSIRNLPRGIETIGSKVFIIERFDRARNGRAVHIEDFAQIFGVYPDDKYKKASLRNLAAVIATESDHTDVAEFIRRITFNVLIGNGDMHLKNWSMIYPDQRHARLSPAYDFVSTIPYIPDDKFALTFSRTKNFTEYTIDEIEHLAAKAALPRGLAVETVKETVDLFMEQWGKEKHHLPMDYSVLKAIDDHLAKLPIVMSNAR